MPVVVMDPAVEHRSALPGMMVGDGIRPFAQGRLNETLCLTIGLRSIGAREEVAHTELAADCGEALGAKGRTVIGEHTAYGDAANQVIVTVPTLGKPGHGSVDAHVTAVDRVAATLRLDGPVAREHRGRFSAGHAGAEGGAQ